MGLIRKTPGCQLHWLTWLVAAICLFAMISRQVEKQPGFGMVHLGHFSERSSFGWPLVHLDYAETQPLVRSALDWETEYYHQWHVWHFLANCFVSLLFGVSAAFVCESWVRAGRRLQFSLRNALIITAVVGVIMALSREQTSPYRGSENFTVAWSFVGWSDLRQPIRWPVIVGLGCTIYFLGWLVVTSALWSWRVFYRAQQ